MFKIIEFKNQTDEYTRVFKKVLAMFQDKLALFKEKELFFVVDKDLDGAFDYKLIASAPPELLGIFAHSAKNAKLVINGELGPFKDEIMFTASLEFDRINGGTEILSIADFGETIFEIVFSMEDNEFSIYSRNKDLLTILDNAKMYLRRYVSNPDKELLINIKDIYQKYEEQTNLTRENKEELLELSIKVAANLKGVFSTKDELSSADHTAKGILNKLENIILDLKFGIKQ